MQLITISKAELSRIIRENVREELENFKQHFSKFRSDDLMTRKEVAQKLKIDLSTLNTWTKDGKLTPHKISRRVYYKKSENPEHLN